MKINWEELKNWEKAVNSLNIGVAETAETNTDIINQLAQKKEEIAEMTQALIMMQSLWKKIQAHKEQLEQECIELESELEDKKSIVDEISSIFKSRRAKNTTVEMGNSDAEKFSHKMSSRLNQLRYQYKKGAISYEEFAQGVQAVGGSIDEELSQI